MDHPTDLATLAAVNELDGLETGLGCSSEGEVEPGSAVWTDGWGVEGDRGDVGWGGYIVATGADGRTAVGRWGGGISRPDAGS